MLSKELKTADNPDTKTKVFEQCLLPRSWQFRALLRVGPNPVSPARKPTFFITCNGGICHPSG